MWSIFLCYFWSKNSDDQLLHTPHYPSSLFLSATLTELTLLALCLHKYKNTRNLLNLLLPNLNVLFQGVIEMLRNVLAKVTELLSIMPIKNMNFSNSSWTIDQSSLFFPFYLLTSLFRSRSHILQTINNILLENSLQRYLVLQQFWIVDRSFID